MIDPERLRAAQLAELQAVYGNVKLDPENFVYDSTAPAVLPSPSEQAPEAPRSLTDLYVIFGKAAVSLRAANEEQVQVVPYYLETSLARCKDPPTIIAARRLITKAALQLPGGERFTIRA